MTAPLLQFFPDPTVKILCMKPLPKVNKLTNDLELINFVEQNPLPFINPKILDQIKSSNTNDPLLDNIVKEIMNDFSYNDDKVRFFLNRSHITTSEAEIALYYILHLFISWKIYYMKENSIDSSNIESIIFILDSLLYISTLTNSTLPSSCFLYISASYFECCHLKNFDQFIPLIRSFFFQTATLPESSFAIFPYIICKFMSNDRNEGNEENELIQSFFKILLQIISKRQDEFPHHLAEETLVALSPFLSKLDKTSLLLFSVLSPILSKETVIQMVITLTAIIADISLKSEFEIVLPKGDESNIKIYNVPEHTLGITIQFPQIPTFLNGFDINNFIPFSEQENIEILIEKDILADVRSILLIIGDNSDFSIEYGKALLRVIEENSNHPKIINLYAILIFSFRYLNLKGDSLPSIEKILNNTIIFDPSVICNDSMSELNSLRAGALELFAYEGSNVFFSLLKSVIIYPDLFGELIRRCISNLKPILPLFATSTKLVRLISNALVHYQKARLEGNEQIDEIRTTLLLFLSHCFADIPCAMKFFSDSVFVRALLSLTFEIPLRNFIFSQLKKFLSLELVKQQKLIGEGFSLIIGTVELSFPETKSLILANELLEMMSDMISYQQIALIEIFASISPLLFSGFSKLDSSNESVTFILDSIQFLTETSHFFKIEKFHFEILFDGIKIAYNPNFNQQFFNKIVQLMAGDRLSTSTTSFVIRHPFATWLLLMTFRHTPKFGDSLNFIIDLCKYHTGNCQKCREGDVDLFLISTIKEGHDIEYESLCFQLLSIIAGSVSAPCVVEKYVSLFQFDGSDVPPYFQSAMKCFVSMIAADIKEPLTVIRLNKSSSFEPQADFSVTNGFTLAFWIYLERTSTQYYPSIISFQDLNGHYFHLFLAYNSLRVSHYENPLSKSEQIMTPVELRQWTFVTITYSIIPPCYYVVAMVNNNGDEIIEKNGKNSINGPVKIRIGGSLNDSIDSEIPCVLGPVAIYPILSEAQMTELFSKGIRSIDQAPVSPIYVYNRNNRLEHQNRSFSRVLTGQVGLTILFPLFTVIDSLLDSAFEVFSSALVTDSSVELEFANTDCFSTVAYLLQENDRSQSTYHLYLKFFTLMQMLKTDSLKQQLFGSIMTNFDLWIHAKIENFLLIVKHWMRTLFPSFVSCVSTMMPFSSLLNQIMIYFNKNDVMNVNLDQQNHIVSKIRTILSQILTFVATISFSFSDFALLISYINKLAADNLSYDHACDAANVLKEIAHMEPSPLASLAEKPKFLPFLHTLLNIPGICGIAIDVIVHMIHKKFITNISLREEVIIILKILPENVVDQKLFTDVARLTNIAPQLFPLCCICGKVLNNNSMIRITDLIHPSPKYLNDNDILFPFIVAHHLQKEARYSVLSFIANCSIEKWKYMFIMITIVNRMYNDKIRQLEADFLIVLADILLTMETVDSNTIKFYIQMAKNFIFFRGQNENCSVFSNLSSSKEEKTDEENENLSMSEIFSKYESFSMEEQNMRFGLRFDKDQNWLDEGLAMKIIMLFEKKNITHNLNFKLTLAFYLINNQTEFVRAHFRDFTLHSPFKEFGIDPYVGILCQKMIRFGIESKILSTTKNIKVDDNIFENFTKSLNQWTNQSVQPFLDDTQLFIINCGNIYKDIPIIMNDQLNKCNISQNETIHRIIRKRMINEKRWHRLSRCLTLPFAPWESKAMNKKLINPRQDNPSNNVYLKKDMRLCGCGFPARSKTGMSKKPNWNIEADSELPFEPDPLSLLMVPCQIIRVTGITNATVAIFQDSIIIHFNSYKSKTYILSNIIEFNTFEIQGNCSGIEIFMKDGKSILINFLKPDVRDVVRELLKQHTKIETVDIFKQWRRREITTFEFLLKLNRRKNRSFNFPHQLPILPLLLIEPESDEVIHSDNNNHPNVDIMHNVSNGDTQTMNNQTENEYPPNKYDNDENDESEIEDQNDDSKPIDSEYVTNISEARSNYMLKSFNSNSRRPDVHFNAPFANQLTKKMSHPIYQDVNMHRFSHSSVGRVTPNNLFGKEIIKLSDVYKTLAEGNHCTADNYIEKGNYYNRRKALESDDVSASLYLWVSKVFNETLTMRSPRNMRIQKSLLAKTNIGCILFASILLSKDDINSFSINMIGVNGILSKGKVTTQENTDIYEIETSENVIEQFNETWKTARFSQLSDHYIAVLDRRMKLSILNINTNFIFDAKESINCIATSDSHLLTTPNTSSVYIYNEKDLASPILKHRFYHSPAKCAAISESFHTIVIGSEGRLIVAPLESGFSMTVIELGGFTPKHIVITENFGFIVTYAQKVENGEVIKALFSHTLSGKPLAYNKVSFELDLMIEFSDCDGVDFLAVADESGKIVTCEAFDLRLSIVIKRCMSPIIAMKYSKDLKSLIVVTQNGNIIVEPISENVI
ncbi:hypothetical protein TRFO_26739 [Tritrichomonas foetus]|uniref:BEACH domain-containing protein n=1 Tax=Tritrichomonas foetus TaxID=1144522 RepID=A0A1J4K2A5_9EUKA|nr:hypothetical protein TRFO_26739 [Tritrichomonas foetus]|eukprot:OHT05527.1 hypothetical protein TRFO_26739 [Tritrichomonas foetus]